MVDVTLAGVTVTWAAAEIGDHDAATTSYAVGWKAMCDDDDSDVESAYTATTAHAFAIAHVTVTVNPHARTKYTTGTVCSRACIGSVYVLYTCILKAVMTALSHPSYMRVRVCSQMVRWWLG